MRGTRILAYGGLAGTALAVDGALGTHCVYAVVLVGAASALYADLVRPLRPGWATPWRSPMRGTRARMERRRADDGATPLAVVKVGDVVWYEVHGTFARRPGPEEAHANLRCEVRDAAGTPLRRDLRCRVDALGRGTLVVEWADGTHRLPIAIGDEAVVVAMDPVAPPGREVEDLEGPPETERARELRTSTLPGMDEVRDRIRASDLRSAAGIAAARKVFAFELHPDRAPPESRGVREEMFVLVNRYLEECRRRL